MRELVAHSFEEGNIPEGWLPQTMNHTYERGCLRSGPVTRLRLPLPSNGWNRLRVEADVEPFPRAVVSCGNDVVSVALKVKEGEYVRHSVGKHNNVLAESFRQAPDKPGIRALAFEFHRGQMSGSVDGEEVVRGADAFPQPFTGWVCLDFWNDCLVYRIRVLGDEPLPAPLFAPGPKRRRDFFLDMAVDFGDDWFCEDSAIYVGERIKYSRKMYDEFFAQLKGCGVRRVAWHFHDLMEDYMSIGGKDDDVGDRFTVAVEMARKHGLQILGVVKPLECSYFQKYHERQPGFQMARKPGAWGEAGSPAVQRIDLVKENDLACAFSVNDLSLFVSDDNRKYRPYPGAMVRAETVEDYPLYEATPSGARKTGLTRRSRVMRLTGLNIPEKYLALSVASRKWSFANTPVNLIHLFGENGEERRLTYGMASNTDLPFVAQGGLDHGVMFDCVIGTPVACFAGFNPAREPFILDLRQGFIAVERGKSRCMDTLGGSLGSPSYAEVRGWWLSWVRAILEAGADGVELRYRNHTSSFNFEEFGFEQPVRDEFLKRAAVDIWETDDFDRSLWRRIRGEGYTEFCREARRMTREAGKTLGLHIDSAMNMEPEEGAAMGIHWDWRMWLREGFADYVLLKEVWPGSLFAQEIVSLARPGRIQVVPSHFAFGCKWKEPGCEQVLDGWLRSARENGCDGFQFCDSAALLHGFSDRQRVLLKNPALRDVLRKHFIKEGR